MKKVLLAILSVIVLLVLFIVMSFTLNFRYASLGTNLIDFSFNDYSNIKVYDFILKNYKNLKFGSSLEVKVKKIKSNPKRLQREARKQSKQVGVGTKSQLALQKQREEMKLERKKESKQIRELENRRKFELKQEKRKQKHRGK